MFLEKYLSKLSGYQKKYSLFFLLLTTLCLPIDLPAHYLKEVYYNYYTNESAEVLYEKAFSEMERKRFRLAAATFESIVYCYPSFSLWEDTHYWLSVAQYGEGELELANETLTTYLSLSPSPCYFKQALALKFKIATLFKGGAKKRLFASRAMPKCLPSDVTAIEIYDEIATLAPCDPLAADALYEKADFLLSFEEFNDALSALQEIIRRFPKEKIAADSYFKALEVLYLQARKELHNTDLIALSELQYKKYALAFPNDPRLEKAYSYVADIKSLAAYGVYKTACFFYQKDNPKAARIYFSLLIEKYPDTVFAEYAWSYLQSCPEET